MISRAKAYALRRMIEKASISLDDTDALTAVELFPAWSDSATYSQGDRVRHNGTLYKCLQDHAAQSDWAPADAVSLWVRVDDPAVEFPDWVQPTGATDAYAKGANVTHVDKHWISDVDGNVWEPGAAGTESLWTEV